jgi:hypothetical protein
MRTDGHTERKTDMMKVIVAFLNFWERSHNFHIAHMSEQRANFNLFSIN